MRLELEMTHDRVILRLVTDNTNKRPVRDTTAVELPERPGLVRAEARQENALTRRAV